MSQRKPLMPKATAVWLVDNTALTFDQIAQFCGLHVLEVKGIADGDVAHGIKGMDPISSGQLTREEIKKGEANPAHDLKIAEPKVSMPQVTTRKKGPRYTPVSRRQDRPNAVLWLLRNHPELKDAQIVRLVGTTKPTITQIKDRSHWNSANLQPQDPVTLGLCSQTELDAEVKKAAARVEKERRDAGIDLEPAGSLLPTAETTDYMLGDGTPQPDVGDMEFPGEEAPPTARSEAAEEARMFEQLRSLSGGEHAPDEDEIVRSAEDVFRQQPKYDEQPDVEDPAVEPGGEPEGEPVAEVEPEAEVALAAGPESDSDSDSEADPDEAAEEAPEAPETGEANESADNALAADTSEADDTVS